MTIQEIDEKLLIGDRIKISKMANCSSRTVRAILKGERNPETETGKKIIKAAEQILAFNEKKIS